MVLPQAPPTPVPATLVLKGIAVNARERFALINDTTVRPNERARVRVGNSNIVIQCLEISTNSVRIRVPGLTNSIELQLDPN